MFLFFVGGVEQQVSQVLKKGAGRCIACGSAADLVRSDKVLKAFFVPLWRWPAKEQLLHCNTCNLFFPPPQLAADQLDALRCRFCHEAVRPDFRFCPFCGSSRS